MDAFFTPKVAFCSCHKSVSTSLHLERATTGSSTVLLFCHGGKLLCGVWAGKHMAFKENKWGFCLCLPPYSLQRRAKQVFSLTLHEQGSDMGLSSISSNPPDDPFSSCQTCSRHLPLVSCMCSACEVPFFSFVLINSGKQRGAQPSLLPWCEGAELHNFTSTFIP